MSVNQKVHPIELFKNAELHGHKVNFASTIKQIDCNTDFAYFDENEKFLFIFVLTHRGAEWCNTFDCGGQGARWCIGYESDDNYWKDYVNSGCYFILAFDKEAFKNRSTARDTMKYMIEFHRDRSYKTRAWLQTDEDEDTIWVNDFEHVFNYDYKKMNDRLSNFEAPIKKFSLDYLITLRDWNKIKNNR